MDVDASVRWQQAEQLSAKGEEAQARTLYAGLTGDPAIAPYAHLRLSVADQRAGDVRGAVAHALDAFRLAQADATLLELLSKLLLRLGETHAALACANALPATGPTPGALAEVGKMLSDHMLPDAALPLLQRAMAAGMAGAPAMQYLLGLNLMYAGDLPAAQQALEASVRGNPELAAAHWALAKLGVDEGRGARIDRLQRLVAAAPGRGPEAALLWYSLFHELDRDAQPKPAWAALETSMRLRRAQVRYDEAAQDALFEAAAQALRQPRRETRVEPAGPTPVFIVGLPRSGTTVIEQALCAQADVASAGELRDLAIQMRWVAQRAGSFNLDAGLLQAMAAQPAGLLGDRYLDHTRWRARGHAFYADKWPENYLAIGHILAALPDARIVCVRRAPADACFSNLKEWFAASYPYSYAQEEVARQYARFDRFLQEVRAVANPRVAFVEYEAFARQPDAAIAGLKLLLDLPDRTVPGAQESVPTASAVQVRGAVSTRHVGAWRRYAEWLGPMLDELARCGYPQGGEAGA